MPLRGALNVNPERTFQLVPHVKGAHDIALNLTLAQHPYYATLIPSTLAISIVRIPAFLATRRTRGHREAALSSHTPLTAAALKPLR